ncbi:MAG: helix-turn-helix transcriptional regulator [Rhizobiales bacterium]|nr:helix-turn-helix transcriptional regulator [Hyphomicrobiales bacterium]
MPSSRRQTSARRKMFLKLSSRIEGQLREIYAQKHALGKVNQTNLAAKLGVDRSAVNRRLSGRSNMTIETIADMIWGLDADFDLTIFDASSSTKNAVLLTNARTDLLSSNVNVNTNTGSVLSTGPLSGASSAKVAFT